MKIKNKNILILILICCLYIFISNMYNAYSITSFIFYQPIRKYLILIMFFLSVILFLKILLKKERINNNIFNMFCFITYVLIIAIITYGFDFTYISSIIWWFVVCFIAYLLPKNVNKKLFDIIIIFSVFLIVYLYYTNALPHWSGDEGTNAIYYAVCLIPFIFMLDNKLIKIMLFSIVTIITFLSGKSTALLMVIFSYIIYIISNKNKNIILMKASGVFGIIIFLIIFIFFKDYLLDLGLDLTGNGRTQIWESVIDNFKYINIFNEIFGIGVNGVTNTIGISAHNDFLEVLFDYGIIGFILYLHFIINLIITAIKMCKEKLKYYDIFAVSIVMTIIISLFSNVIFIPRYFVAISFIWGYILGINNEYLKKSKVVIK